MKETPTQKATRNFRYQALLQEYANAVQLYTNTILVTFTRFYGLLATQGAVAAAVFLANVPPAGRIGILIVGFLLAIFTYYGVEHHWRFIQFRLKQARAIEKQINELITKEPLLTTFDHQYKLFIQDPRKEITFDKKTCEKVSPDWFHRRGWQPERLFAKIIMGAWVIGIIFYICYVVRK